MYILHQLYRVSSLAVPYSGGLAKTQKQIISSSGHNSDDDDNEDCDDDDDVVTKRRDSLSVGYIDPTDWR